MEYETYLSKRVNDWWGELEEERKVEIITSAFHDLYTEEGLKIDFNERNSDIQSFAELYDRNDLREVKE